MTAVLEWARIAEFRNEGSPVESVRVRSKGRVTLCGGFGIVRARPAEKLNGNANSHGLGWLRTELKLMGRSV